MKKIYKASEIFTKEEAEFVKYILKEFNGKVDSITELKVVYFSLGEIENINEFISIVKKAIRPLVRRNK